MSCRSCHTQHNGSSTRVLVVVMCKLILSAMQITERNTGVKRRLENVKMTVAWLGVECCDRTCRTERTDDKDNINTEVDGLLKLFD